MKMLKKMSCLLLTTAIFFACNEEDGFTTPPAPPPPAPNSFEASLDMQQISGSPAGYGPVLLLKVSYEGSGTSNMMPQFTLEATHVEEVIQGQLDFNIEQGHFILRDKEENKIYGSYRGHGSQSFSSLQMDWTLQIQGGTGKFDSARGNLTLSATDRSLQDPAMGARISGSIELTSQF